MAAPDDKRAKLAEILRKKASERTISLEQERLWFLDRMLSDRSVFNISVHIRIRGEFEASALSKALSRLIKRHEVLRSTFLEEDGKPIIRIAESTEITIQSADLIELSVSEKDRRLSEIGRSAKFHLDRPPLIDAVVAKTAPLEQTLVLTIPHIISDGESARILASDFMAIYEACLSDQVETLQILPTQFGDIAKIQRERLNGSASSEHVRFWEEKLKNAPGEIGLPWDYPPTQELSFQGAMTTYVVPQETTLLVREFLSRENTTLFALILTAFEVTLSRYALEDDVLVGMPFSGRVFPNSENLVGFFAYPVVLRADLSSDPSFSETIQRTKETVYEAFDHAEIPFSKVVEIARPARSSNRLPLIQVACDVAKIPQQDATARMQVTDIQSNSTMGFSLFFRAFDWNKEKIELQLGYDPTQLSKRTVDQFCRDFVAILHKGLEQPSTKISLIKSVVPPRRREIVVASTYTAEPLHDVLRYWLNDIGEAAKITFAPYNQVFQQLLEPSSLFKKNNFGLNVILVRTEDWARYQNTESSESSDTRLRKNAHDLVSAIELFSKTNSTPLLVCLCPNSPINKQRCSAIHSEISAHLVAQLRALNSVYVVTPEMIADLYPVAEFYSETTDREGHIPYTPHYFAALASIISRHFYSRVHSPAKVIVLDCDNTLWGGVCGEVGPTGVELSESFINLQRAVVEKQQNGILVCLCSKNAPEDVFAVFEQRSEMVLKKEHLAASKINWEPKSQNLKALASELNLGIDSFVFLDDNPVECAEVQSAIPEVLTFQIPRVFSDNPHFPTHIWPLDQLKVSAEDRQRTQMYQENRQRTESLSSSTSFADFIASLNLKVTISKIDQSEVGRVSQLTQRTNQFNTTTLRRTEAEIAQLDGQGKQCFTVRVSDRFGDYGLVGVFVVETKDQALVVDSLLLSCRVLGRGTEHKMVAHLGSIARKENLEYVDVRYRSTAKNMPVRDFLNGLEEAKKVQEKDEVITYRLTTETAEGLRFNMGDSNESEQWFVEKADVSSKPGNALKESINDRKPLNAALQRIAEFSRDPNYVLELLARGRTTGRQGSALYVAPITDNEIAVAKIFSELLKVEQIGLQDNFFELGGHSILSIQLLDRIRRSFGVDLPVSMIFSTELTLGKLVQLIEEQMIASTDEEDLAQLLENVENLSDSDLKELVNSSS